MTTIELLVLSCIIFICIYCIKIKIELNKANNKEKENKRKLKIIKAIINSSLESIVLINKDNIVYSNKEFLKLSNYKRKNEVKNKNINTFFKNELFLNENRSDNYGVLLTKEQKEINVIIKNKNIEYEKKEYILLCIYNLDLLKDKNTYINEAKKLASMGEMLSNIAHQWKQPLSAISSAASGLLIYKDIDKLDNNITETFAQTILSNCNYLSDTIDDFNTILENKSLKERIKISMFFDQCLTLVNSILQREEIIIKIDIKEDIEISTHVNDLLQVLISLINNSKDAFIENNISNRMIFINVNIDNKLLYIEFFDNALGVKEEILNNIFEPYFTTKYKSEGKGLSLYTAYKFICEKLEGKISCSNKQFIFNRTNYKGASFKLKINKE